MATQPVNRTDPAASEACRLLCAGVYLDAAFRDRVINELYVHDERVVAPSSGFDAARVLAHALRARRIDLVCGMAILAVWTVTVMLLPNVFFLLIPVVVLAAVPALRAGDPRAGRPRRVLAQCLRWYGLLALLNTALTTTVLAAESLRSLGGGPTTETFTDIPLPWPYGAVAHVDPRHAWAALAVFLMLALAVGAQRAMVAGALAGTLSPSRFPDLAADPAEQADGSRFHRVRTLIRREQHAPLVLYRVGDPFCGSGTPHEAWSTSVELRPRKGHAPGPLDNDTVLNWIRQALEPLREPSGGGAQQGAAAVRDRLRTVEADEYVFLPVDGLPSRHVAPHTQEEFELHRAASIEEGGEARRHCLRIRVGGWGEGLVVTVFVRVHTRGGVMVLELAPHVLWPLRPQFQNADRIAHRLRHQSLAGKALWALGHTPESLGLALRLGASAVFSAWAVVTLGDGRLLPDGPAVSLRELGSDDEPSHVQKMDADRYLRGIQDRVTGGVQQALYEAGWQTTEERTVNVGNGGVFIDTVHGAVGVGDHNAITTHTTPHSGTAAKERKTHGNC
ncbi:hypothetical protein [Streptomyces sp. NPDC059080]|uniref:hypothetical protein n=1 Tax=Streptomyces sp. NPDC059080 TaxID=3346718 RepID=UPI0036CE23CC